METVSHCTEFISIIETQFVVNLFIILCTKNTYTFTTVSFKVSKTNTEKQGISKSIQQLFWN